MQQLKKTVVTFLFEKFKATGKGKVHPRTDHEGPEGGVEV